MNVKSILLEQFKDNQTPELLEKLKAEGVKIRKLTNGKNQHWKEVENVVLPIRYIPIYDTMTRAANNDFDIGIY